jgi:hypothetical protein
MDPIVSHQSRALARNASFDPRHIISRILLVKIEHWLLISGLQAMSGIHNENTMI